MAKINLLTIHWGLSYGGTLQTYATVKLLKDLGHTVTVINLVHPKHNVKKLLAKGYSYGFWIRYFQFAWFKKKYIGGFTRKMYSLNKELVPNCDYFVVGSDQVWNKDITGPLALNYFLDFADGKPRISLSSSFGKDKWEEDADYTKNVQKEINSFKGVSVREESGQMILRSVFSISSTQLLDPTLLLGDFDDIVDSDKEVDVIYPFLLDSDNPIKQEMCRIISSKLKTPLLNLSKLERVFAQSPKAWLKRMKRSKYIITDSFHGLAFSVIFNKRFFVLPTKNSKQFTRLASLLKLLKLNDCYFNSTEDLLNRVDSITNPIDYSYVNHVLQTERQKYQEYIEHLIS